MKDMFHINAFWENYEQKICSNWEHIVHEEDLVLVAGDISWGKRVKDALPDLDRLDRLPGQKILLRGNHDYWWQSLKQLRELEFQSLSFLQNNAFVYQGVRVVGTKGALQEEEGIYRRELQRLLLSLDFPCDQYTKTICIMHYPPIQKGGEETAFTKVFEDYQVDLCIYGHLHGDGLRDVFEGEFGGVQYLCSSADYLDFQPRWIGEYNGKRN